MIVCTATKTCTINLPKVHTKRQSKLAILYVMIRIFLIFCCTLFTSLILTTWEIPVQYRPATCFPRVFPIPFSFTSLSLYSTHALLMTILLALSILSCFVFYHLLNTLFICLMHFLNILISYATNHSFQRVKGICKELIRV